jgi:hypothetical protein
LGLQNQITSRPLRCASIGRFPILHPPGNGIKTFQKKYNNGESKKIDDLIFFIFSKSKFLGSRKDESMCKLFPSKE